MYSVITNPIPLTSALVSLAVFLGAAEFIGLKASLQRDSLIAWNICRMRRLGTVSDFAQKGMDAAFGHRGSLLQMVARLVLSTAILILAPKGNLEAVAFLMIMVLFAVWAYRSPAGSDGSDQMITVLSGALSVYYLCNSAPMANLCYLFITCQLTICYCTSGIYKLLSSEWRSGEAIKLVFRTKSYGNSFIYKIIGKIKAFPVLIAWSIIIFETCFPAVFFVRWPTSAFLLIIPALFHVSTAMFMGLNVFAFSYLASYPVLLRFLNDGPASVLASIQALVS